MPQTKIFIKNYTILKTTTQFILAKMTTDKLEPLNEQQTFEQIIKSIKEENLNDLKELLVHARDKRFINLPTRQDENGNTVFHHAIMQAKLEIMRILSAYEAGFESSYGIENNEGKTPYQCLLDLPEDKSEFKEKGKALLGPSPSWKQSYILNQFRLYLYIQQKEHPELYSERDVLAIINNLKTGHCNGFSAIWLQGWFDGQESRFKDLFESIVNWDQSKSSLNERLIRQFEYAILLTRSYQMDAQMPELRESEERTFYESIALVEEHHQKTVQHFLRNFATPENEGRNFIFVNMATGSQMLSAVYSKGKIFLYPHGEEQNKNACIRSFEVSNEEGVSFAASEISKYSSPWNFHKKLFKESQPFKIQNPKNWEQIWDKEHYQQEATFDSNVTLELLQEFLENIAVPENNGKGFNFFIGAGGGGSQGHIISAAYRDGRFFIYDSNYPGKEDGSGPLVKSFDLSNKRGCSDAALEIRQCLHDRISTTPGNSFRVGLCAFDKKGNVPGKYKSFEEMKARAIYQLALKGELVDPILFVNNIDLIHRQLLPNELDIFYQRVKFDETKINQQIDSFTTPLSAAIVYDYPQAVRALLEGGANPNLAHNVYGDTPLLLAKKNVQYNSEYGDIVSLMERKSENRTDSSKRTIKTEYTLDGDDNVKKIGENTSSIKPG